MSESHAEDAHAEASARPPLDHRLRRMVGRDPDEPHRAATPLELLFDLTFVVAFSQAGAQTAHLLELGHWAPGDRRVRVRGLRDLVGVDQLLVARVGLRQRRHLLPRRDDGRDARRARAGARPPGALPLARRGRARRQRRRGGRVRRHARRDDRAVAARREARPRPQADRTHVRRVRLGHSRLGWIVLIFVNLPLAPTLAFTLLLVALELVAPYVAEHGREGGTPWHAHHIAERYGLLVIITLGEIILGTILAISAVIDEQGWSVETVAVAFGGTALAFGLWWVYFTMPSGKVLAALPRARLRVGLPPLLHLRRARRRRRRPARGRLRDRGRRPHRHRAGAPDRRRPRRDLHGRAVHDLLAAAAAVRPVPHLAVRRQHPRCSCSRWSPWRPGRASASAS